MKTYLKKLKSKIQSDPLTFYEGGDIPALESLYFHYTEKNPYDNEQIKADFNELYRQMNGMPLREMDKIIYPVCKLCRDHERAGFTEGVKVGILMHDEIN